MKHTHKRNLISIAMAAVVLVSMCAMCASTGVSAADNGKASAHAPSLVSAAVPGGASACTQDGKTLDLFAKGTNNALWWKHYDGNTWSTWKSLGGYLTSDPAAVDTSIGTMTVFVRGGDGALWQAQTTNGWTSSSWTTIGGQLLSGTGPGVAENTPFNVFVIGMDHALWLYKTSTGWQKIGGYATSSPAAAADDYTGNYYAYVRGGDGALWQCYVPTTTWAKIGGNILAGTSPAASADYHGRAVFVIGTNHALWWISWYQNGQSAWQSLGGYLTSSPAATYRWLTAFTYTVDVFGRGGDGALWWRSGATPGSSAYTWSSWTSIGGM